MLLPLEAAEWPAHPMGLSYARHCECRLVASRQLLCTLLSSLPYCMSSGANGCKVAIVAGLGVLRRGEAAAFCAAQHATNVPQAKPRYPPDCVRRMNPRRPRWEDENSRKVLRKHRTPRNVGHNVSRGARQSTTVRRKHWPHLVR